ncbi:hypothetical protein Efla_000617 [Eimeria flavescens]
MKRQREGAGQLKEEAAKLPEKKLRASLAKPWLRGVVDTRRVRCLTPTLTLPKAGGRNVVCLLQRDLRLEDNWALLFAQDAALSLKVPLYVVHLVITKHTYQATLRHLAFHLKGVAGFAQDLAAYDIGFHCVPVTATEDHASLKEATQAVKALLEKLEPSVMVCDFMPLRRPTQLTESVAGKCFEKGCPLYQVDAHNVVPVWLASKKQEHSARTFRPRVLAYINEFACEFPLMQRHPHKGEAGLPEKFSMSDILSRVKHDASVTLPKQWLPGCKAGLAALRAFCTAPRLAAYASRNNPVVEAQSGLSPWLHFGQLSTQRCVVSVKKLGPGTKLGAAAAAMRDSFIEELVVRRELAENFIFYNSKYDQVGGALRWAQDTLALHRRDKREHLYSLADFEHAKTHDELWNAAQLQLVREGKMHGFLRMYWAKKILEWTYSPESALEISLFLNDKYSLDGTDPNGVVGCMWSIAGVHDQGWAERPVFGKIRFMNLQGCRRKFPVDEYVAQFPAVVRPPIDKLLAKSSRVAKQEGKPLKPVTCDLYTLQLSISPRTSKNEKSL